MKFSDEYRNGKIVLALSEKIKQASKRDIVLMEVCGGHTMAIHRFGLNSLLPPNIRLVSGPGCPVCVSAQKFIDTAITYSHKSGIIVATYGDLIRVPGSGSSLEKERAAGADIRIIYSVLEAVAMARANPDRMIVFPGIGFETTAPATAAAIRKAHEEGITNFLVLSAHKTMPPVMAALVEEGIKIDGFIAPGHVSAITGTVIFDSIASTYGLGVVVSGFEPADMMQSVLMLVNQIENGRPSVEIQYGRVVSRTGNQVAVNLLHDVFEPCDDIWRGLGVISGSGLRITDKYRAADASVVLPVEVPPSTEPKGCICGLILKGLKRPPDCPLFARKCTPQDPVGACMVSGEGTCATYYRYRS
jgi:hydrogenase expression/formation protein HypD